MLESCLGLDFWDFSMWHFLKLVVRGFLQVLQFPPLCHQLINSANKIKVKSGCPLYVVRMRTVT